MTERNEGGENRMPEREYEQDQLETMEKEWRRGREREKIQKSEENPR